MAHPLFSFAEKLERKRKTRHIPRDLNEVINDPHIARDIGLPYNPTPRLRIDQW